MLVLYETLFRVPLCALLPAIKMPDPIHNATLQTDADLPTCVHLSQPIVRKKEHSSYCGRGERQPNAVFFWLGAAVCPLRQLAWVRHTKIRTTWDPRYYDAEQLLAVFDTVTIEDVQKQIPELLGRIHLECLVRCVW